MRRSTLYVVVRYLMAAVWIVNGFFCKILNLVPRHQEIVERIFGDSHARLIIVLIGISELIMALWILSNIRPKFNAVNQILVVVTMNIIEFCITPDLLMWGRTNAIFALLFVLVVYWNEFVLKSRLT